MSNSNPKISIVLPCYNGADLLGNAVNSIIGQTFQDWELIIVNDCSTDNTLEVANMYASKDERIRVFSNEKNSKLPATLNHGFREARGEYWTWTSDDNLLHPTMLEKMSDYLNQHGDIGFVVSDQCVIDMDGNIINEIRVPDNLNFSLMLNNYVGASFMYRKSVALAAGEYREDLFLVEDYEFWLRLSGLCRIGVIHEFLYSYRENPKSLTATKKKEIAKCLCNMRLMYLSLAEKRLKNDKKSLSLFYYRIVDNLSGYDRLRYYLKFSATLPLTFGIKYVFVHLPNRLIKRIK